MVVIERIVVDSNNSNDNKNDNNTTKNSDRGSTNIDMKHSLSDILHIPSFIALQSDLVTVDFETLNPKGLRVSGLRV